MALLKTIDNTQLYYQDLGASTDTTLVCVAGAGLPHEIWSYNLPFFLERGARVVVFDRRGHGRSDPSAAGYDLDTLARDLGSVLHQLDLREVTLIGHSLGGAEIVRYLSRYREPGRVTNAVLIAPTAPRLTWAEDYAEGMDPAVARALEADFRRDFSGWIAGNKRGFFAPQTSDALVDWGARLLEAIPLHVYLQIWKTTCHLDLRADLPRLRVPTLLIHGDLDQSVPVTLAEHAARLIPSVIFRRYPDAAHGMFITHAGSVHRDIADFIDEGAGRKL